MALGTSLVALHSLRGVLGAQGAAELKRALQGRCLLQIPAALGVALSLVGPFPYLGRRKVIHVALMRAVPVSGHTDSLWHAPSVVTTTS